ncbi:transcriptional regulator [Pseudomonas sp. BJa5]|uniref:winged helix-turn-helix domain-containing protein n=1 Tax=Pseudomonas sp. BJa5 TaxID=2936270 RepID=UPI0025595DD5|nr:winged helix-turn-helix domain-containing protein [Pseudomonas sp. BGr12]MDL2420209.1 winged helix-turn-helix domain-containing protein [Pseudomonas sp. BGr12]
MLYHFRLKNSALVEFNSEHCKIIITDTQGSPEEITLARADSRALELLLMDPGAICSREDILAYAWEGRVVSAGSLNQSIFMLRNLLGDSKDHEILITVPRRGYRFNSDYLLSAPEVAQTPQEQAPASVQPPVVQAASKQGIGTLVRLGYLLAVVCSLLSLWRLYSWYAPTNDLHIATIRQGELSISAVGKSEHDVKTLKSDLLTLGLSEQNLNGQVFISRTGTRINLSCIRQTGGAYNVEFQFDDERIIGMLKKCMGGE